MEWTNPPHRRGNSSRYIEYNIHDLIQIQNQKDGSKKIGQETREEIKKRGKGKY